jgi:hypothetical protein
MRLQWRFGRRFAWSLAALPLGAALSAPACIDASHDAEVQALGGEAADVRPGPTHRPGQPCLVCHGGLGPGSPQFVMAGTVYAVQGQTPAARDAQVRIEDVNGSTFDSTTNEVGNFYITTDEWAPTLPAQVIVSQGAEVQQMLTHIGRDGSCAGCHLNPLGATSPGPVYVMSAPLPDGGP